MINIDFDYWSNLAKTNPVLFEQERIALIQSEISKANPKNQLKLTALQCKVNRIIRTSVTPMNACIMISEIMWDSFRNQNEHYLSMLEAVRNDRNSNRL